MPMGHRINQHDPAPQSAGFSDEQFAELVRLLTPIHKAAVLMLEHIEREKEQPEAIGDPQPGHDPQPGQPSDE